MSQPPGVPLVSLERTLPWTHTTTQYNRISSQCRLETLNNSCHVLTKTHALAVLTAFSTLLRADSSASTSSFFRTSSSALSCLSGSGSMTQRRASELINTTTAFDEQFDRRTEQCLSWRPFFVYMQQLITSYGHVICKSASVSYFFALLLLVVNAKGFELSGVPLASCSLPTSSSCVN